MYKEIQEWLSHLSKLIKLDANVAIESRFPRFKWIFTEIPGQWKYLLCAAKLDSSIFHRSDHIPPWIHCPVCISFKSKSNSLKIQSWMALLLTLYSHMWLTLYKCHSFSLEDPLSFTSWLPQHLSDISKNHFHKAAIPDSDTFPVSLLCGHMAFCAYVSQLWWNI